MKIVVIEDEDNTRSGIIKLIGKLGSAYEVIGEADNGISGISLIEELRPDLVIADIKMPQATGIEMLQQLKERGHRHKTVILTGFSEYEYARKALQLGVFEFLEKPITAEDLRTTLEKVQEELSFQSAAGMPAGNAAAQAEQLLQLLLARDDIDRPLLSTYIGQGMSLKENLPLYLVTVYLGKQFNDVAVETMLPLISSLLKPFGRQAVCSVVQDQSLAALVQPDQENRELQRYIEEVLLPAVRNIDSTAVISFSELDEISRLKPSFDQLAEWRKWFIAVENDTAILNERLVDRLQLERRVLSYPSTIENKLKMAVSAQAPDEAAKCLNHWLDICQAGVYDPQHIIDASVRLVTAMLQTVSDLYGERIAFDYQQEWLHPILSSQTREELQSAFAVIARQLAAIRPASNPVPYSMIVQKTVRILQEKYTDGVTLEEIAAELHITPEYLSGLFTRETGRNFTAFLKEHRIRKAKELLLESGLKMFEIAQRVGYPDPKYFSRVFKEMTGLSPAEYQKLNRG
ncbi:response regulator [Paenibacillus gorillae]|uniref:response regulator n=1 Tax=Paenibacillus gorillae TaxID=1243662 RepID=UPI0004B88C08|nr:response regulator [Paenibacillus gorillae]